LGEVLQVIGCQKLFFLGMKLAAGRERKIGGLQTNLEEVIKKDLKEVGSL